MNWTDLVERVAARTGLPETRVRSILNSTVAVSLEALAEGQDVSLRGLGTLTSRWREPATLRSIGDRRRLRVDGRFVPKFRAARRLRAALAERTPQRWRDPAHQTAWRVAETLISDLALYHQARAPQLDPAAPAAEVEAACVAAFGPVWRRVRETFDAKVSADVRAMDDYLSLAARSRWASPAS